MAADRKIQIIRTAVKRFAKHGLNKTTLDEIARDVRIGKATIYHYFTSKEELFYQAIDYDVSLFIEDIKQIFNNEQLSFKERFIEYFNYKQDIYNKYKLLYDLIMKSLKEDVFEKELEILKKLLQNEEEVLMTVFKSIYNKKIESMNPALPNFFAIQSWGILFGSKLYEISGDSVLQNSKELFYTSLECALNFK